jgi:hypothetical protein
MIKYIIAHCKHEGCYDFSCYEDHANMMRITSIKINPPKIYMFEKKIQAMEFFNDYINDLDCIDVRCKKTNGEVEHIDYCTCGIIEMDSDENPTLFYNKTNQVFFLENGMQSFLVNEDLQMDISNMNTTNRLIKKCKKLDKEQQMKYIELGKACEECVNEDKNKIKKEIVMYNHEYDNNSDSNSDNNSQPK